MLQKSVLRISKNKGSEGFAEYKQLKFYKNQTGEYTVLDNGEALKSGVLNVTDIPERRIWKDSGGEVWTLDHRRLGEFINGGR